MPDKGQKIVTQRRQSGDEKHAAAAVRAAVRAGNA
jgi:hypothetical protein